MMNWRAFNFFMGYFINYVFDVDQVVNPRVRWPATEGTGSYSHVRCQPPTVTI